MKTTLQELETKLNNKKSFELSIDLFGDLDIERDLFYDDMKSGTIADDNGDYVFDFKIIKLDKESGHLDTIVEFDGRFFNRC